MSDPKELIDKTNALLGRYRSSAAPASDFPTLTEIVTQSARPARSSTTFGEANGSSADLPGNAPSQEGIRPPLEEMLQARLHAAIDARIDKAMAILTEGLEEEVNAAVRDALKRTSPAKPDDRVG